MSTNNICFHREIRKHYVNTPSYLYLWLIKIYRFNTVTMQIKQNKNTVGANKTGYK